MSVLPYLIIVCVLGLVVSRLAPLLVPGEDPVGIDRSALVGICAALIAGLFSWYVLARHGWGIFISVLVSMLVVWLYRRPRPATYRQPRTTDDRGPRVADNRGSRAAQYRGTRPADNPGSRPAGYRGRTPGGRRPPV